MDHGTRDNSARLILASVPVQALLMAGVLALALGGRSAAPAPDGAYFKPVPGPAVFKPMSAPDACKFAMWKSMGKPYYQFQLAQDPSGASVRYLINPDPSGASAVKAGVKDTCTYTLVPQRLAKGPSGAYEPMPGNPDAPMSPAGPAKP